MCGAVKDSEIEIRGLGFSLLRTPEGRARNDSETVLRGILQMTRWEEELLKRARWQQRLPVLLPSLCTDTQPSGIAHTACPTNTCDGSHSMGGWREEGERHRVEFSLVLYFSACVCMCMYMSLCVCLCVCVFVFVYVHVHVIACMPMCLCFCVLCAGACLSRHARAGRPIKIDVDQRMPSAGRLPLRDGTRDGSDVAVREDAVGDADRNGMQLWVRCQVNVLRMPSDDPWVIQCSVPLAGGRSITAVRDQGVGSPDEGVLVDHKVVQQEGIDKYDCPRINEIRFESTGCTADSVVEEICCSSKGPAGGVGLRGFLGSSRLAACDAVRGNGLASIWMLLLEPLGQPKCPETRLVWGLGLGVGGWGFRDAISAEMK